MNVIINLPDIIKVIIELIIFVLFFISYTKIYKNLIIKICDSYSLASANDYYSLMKLFSRIGLFVVFALYVFFTPNILNILLFIPTWIMFVSLWIMSKMSTNLMEYLVDFKFDKSQINGDTYYSFIGSVELINGIYVFSYLPGRFELDIEKKKY